MTPKDHRYYVISPDGSAVTGFDLPEVARHVALEFGDSAHVIDSKATPYYPMAEQVQGGELVYLEFGAWDTKIGLDHNLIEAVRKGYPPIVRVFLAKGADPNASDAHGGTALIWAVARGQAETVRLLIDMGAKADLLDADGLSAMDLAQKKQRREIIEILEKG